MEKKDRLFLSDIQWKLGYHCAPTIVGWKAASIICIDVDEMTDFFRAVKKMTISHCVFYQDKSHIVLFLYRKNLLERHIMKKENQEALAFFHYDVLSFDGLIQELKERFQKYKTGKTIFPHEIGIFLEYPLEDLFGFIEKEGKNALYQGYWKVYGSVEKAKAIFEEYDFARKQILYYLKKGNELSDVFYHLERKVYCKP